MTEAEGHVCSFARAIAAMLRAGAVRFDLVVAPYNSGAVMVRLAERVARSQGVRFWPALLIPVFTPYRFADYTSSQAMPYDNAALIPGVRKTLASFQRPVRALLFIDDEIGNGSAFNECMKVVAAARAGGFHGRCSCVIVADEDGTHKAYSFPGMAVNFTPYAVRPSPNVAGIIFDLVPDSVVDAFRAVGNGLLDKKQVASVLLGLPVKALINGVPQITNKLNRQAESSIRNLARLRVDFEAYVDGLIASALRRG
jgi:hypothetical protein